MARHIVRPIGDQRYGTVGGWDGIFPNPVPNALGDNRLNTGYWFHEGGGVICDLPDINASTFGGRKVLAVRIAHLEEQGGLFGLDNGWVMSDLLHGDGVILGARVYWQDGQRGRREKKGPAIYAGPGESWSVEQLNNMRLQVGAARGEDWGPNRSNQWCRAIEAWMEVVTPAPLNRPTLSNMTTDSVNPRMSVTVRDVEPEQRVQAVFQVAPDTSFSRDVREYTTPMTTEETSTPTLHYKGDPGGDSHANLAPGVWQYRVKVIDMLGTESDWSAPARITVNLSPTLPVPILVEPRPGATYQDPLAERSARFDLGTDSNGAPLWTPGERLLGVEWQFSQDSTFSNSEGIVRWTNYQGTFGGSTPTTVRYNPTPVPGQRALLHGPVVSVHDVSQRLRPQGTWYVQVRAVDSFGNRSDWTQPASFIVKHAPKALNLTPSGEDFDPRMSSFRWTFSDPWPQDRQTAYRLLIHEMPAATQMYDSGKVYSSSEGANVDADEIGLGDTPRNLRVRVSLWDSDDMASDAYASSTFRYRRAPIVTITSPLGLVDSGQPIVTWTTEFSENTTQVKYRVIITNTSTGMVEHDSGTVGSTEPSHAVQSSMLSNMSHFEVRVYVFDSGQLTGWSLETFSTSFVVPEPLATTAEAHNYEQDGYVDVWWTGAPDAFFQEYRIYRREYRDGLLPDEGWILSGTVTNMGASHFRDYNPSGAAEFEFSVVQVANRYGSPVEGPKRSTPSARVMVFSSNYWLIVPGEEELSIKLHSVVGDSFTEQYESSTYNIVGGGARVNRGARIGLEGSLACQIRASTVRGAREQITMLRELAGRQQYLIMRDPFGNATKISIGDISGERIGGVGTHEFADIEVPYTEVM